jgi:hypothetical protein
VKAARCKGKVVNAQELEMHVWQRCRQFVRHPDEVVAALARQRAQMPEPEDTTAQEQELSRKLAAKQQDEALAFTAFRRGLVKLAAFEAEMDTIEAERKVLQDELTALQVRHKRHHARLDYFARSVSLLERWQSELARIEAEDDREGMQRLIADLVLSITVYPDRVHVIYRFDEAEAGAAVGEADCVAVGSSSRILSGPPIPIWNSDSPGYTVSPPICRPSHCSSMILLGPMACVFRRASGSCTSTTHG